MSLVVPDDLEAHEFSHILQRLLEAEMTVAVALSLRPMPAVGLGTSYFLGRNILLFQVRSNLRQLPRRMLKRAFDLVGAFGLLVLFSPVFAAAAFAIKRFDGGPVFYLHERIGRDRVPFNCIKFRTMTVDADTCLAKGRVERPEFYEEFQMAYKLRDDARVTGPGKWLRRTSLDEVPQLINVLRGEMSLVGPRPVIERELNDHYQPASRLYCQVRPGMTGLWQVNGRSDTSYEQRISYDEWYILNWTFWHDIAILFRTARIMISGKGAF
jgi:undecaprenyl-phosphate galactose phosphotransferase